MFSDLSANAQALRERLLQFFEAHIYPNEGRYREETEALRLSLIHI